MPTQFSTGLCTRSPFWYLTGRVVRQRNSCASGVSCSQNGKPQARQSGQTWDLLSSSGMVHPFRRALAASLPARAPSYTALATCSRPPVQSPAA